MIAKDKKLALRIAKEGAMTRAEIARALNLSHQLISYYNIDVR
jgi:DNA-binding CsgD family transcriptional regulator